MTKAQKQNATATALSFLSYTRDERARIEKAQAPGSRTANLLTACQSVAAFMGLDHCKTDSERAELVRHLAAFAVRRAAFLNR